MTTKTIALIISAALHAVESYDVEDLDPDEIDMLAEDGAAEWAESYGSEGAFIYADAFCGAALERIGL